MKRSCKAEDILIEEYQAFTTIIAKTLILDETFQYPITSVSLSIAILEEDLPQSEKASLRNFLISNSNTTTNCISEKVSWLIDSLAVV